MTPNLEKDQIPYTIYVHDGRAHMDELLAAALYVTGSKRRAFQVERLNQREAAGQVDQGQSDHRAHVFIDCGGVHDPDRNLFDHHQDPALPSAAQLVFQHLFAFQKTSPLSRMVDWVSRMDTQGPQLLKQEGLDPEKYAVANLGQDILLRAFEINPNKTLAVFLDGLKERLEQEYLADRATRWIEQNCETVTHAGVNLLQLRIHPPKELKRAIKGAQIERIKQDRIVAIYGFDTDQKGVRNLFRTFLGDAILDFTRATPQQELFKHNNGFLLKFRPAESNEWLNLVAQSLTV